MTDHNRNCWIAAAVLGLLVWVFTAGLGDLSWLSGLILGLITMGLFGAFLTWLSGGARAVDGIDWDKSAVRQPIVTQEAAKESEAPAEPAVAEQIAPTGDAQVQAESAERPVSTRNDIYAAKSAEADTSKADAKADTADAKVEKADAKVKKADSKTDAVKKPAVKKSPAKKAAVDTKPVKATAKKKATKPAAAKTSNAKPDDLKEIKGIGPKLEELLHENGITRFSQIAEWSDGEVEHFAELIGRMGGRIRSDDWLGQARILADGGSTEFSKRVEKGDVYV